MTPAALALALRGVNFRFTNEAELQEGIARVLTDRGVAFEREVKLAAADRIDFMVGAVGIEVKVDGPLSALTRQVHRYVQHDRIKGILIVSSLNRLAFGMPAAINDKPVFVHVVSRAFE